MSSAGKKWMDRHTNDPYVKKATAENLRARSAFKLTEIQDKKKIIKPNSFVLDLGAAPGSWSVAVSKIIDPAAGGLLCSVDLLNMEPVPLCTFIQGDFLTKEVQDKVLAIGLGRKPDVILSDMLCNRTGHKGTDMARSEELYFTVFEYCMDHLRDGGNMLVKILRSGNDEEIMRETKKIFRQVSFMKPLASRNSSSEIYVMALNKF
jgi:23S rRNA (uridine2552-2'-O)-methyltransferase